MRAPVAASSTHSDCSARRTPSMKHSGTRATGPGGTTGGPSSAGSNEPVASVSNVAGLP